VAGCCCVLLPALRVIADHTRPMSEHRASFAHHRWPLGSFVRTSSRCVRTPLLPLHASAVNGGDGAAGCWLLGPPPCGAATATSYSTAAAAATSPASNMASTMVAPDRMLCPCCVADLPNTMAGVLSLGGVMGYVKGKSMPSLLGGVGLGAGFAVAGWAIKQGRCAHACKQFK
jgi:hypothetical protein